MSRVIKGSIKVDKRGRMTLPAFIREYLKIRNNALIPYEVTDDSIILKALPEVTKK